MNTTLLTLQSSRNTRYLLKSKQQWSMAVTVMAERNETLGREQLTLEQKQIIILCSAVDKKESTANSELSHPKILDSYGQRWQNIFKKSVNAENTYIPTVTLRIGIIMHIKIASQQCKLITANVDFYSIPSQVHVVACGAHFDHLSQYLCGQTFNVNRL